jgi:hypothetical protein
MSLSIAVVCENRADFETISSLIDRILLEAAARFDPPWIDAETLDDHRSYRGFYASQRFLRWTELKPIADELDLVIRFKGETPIHPYAQNALRAIRVLALAEPRIDAMVLVADSDGDLERREGLEQARRYSREALPIVVGLAHTKRECWHLNGFEPADKAEQARLDEVHQELGFDPRLRSEQLTAKHDHDRRSAKRVLAALCGDRAEREQACLASLSILASRGERNGLRAFLNDVRDQLVPVLFGRAQ